MLTLDRQNCWLDPARTAHKETPHQGQGCDGDNRWTLAGWRPIHCRKRRNLERRR